MKPFDNVTTDLFNWLAVVKGAGAFCVKVTIWNTITKEPVGVVPMTLPHWVTNASFSTLQESI